MKKLKYIPLLLFLLIFLSLVYNKVFHTSYQDLSPKNQEFLRDYDYFYKKNPHLWEGYALHDKTILLVDENAFGPLYILNPKGDFKSPWAREILLPKTFQIKVFRLALSHPKRLQYILGNFNSKDKTYQLLGQDNLFYVKTHKDSLAPRYKSSRFIPFLAHEAFHYYVQKDWKDETFRGLSYSWQELQLLDKEYQILDKIKEEVGKEATDKIILKTLLKDYLAVMEERSKKTDPEKLKAELIEETIEGTAQYVGIKAAKATGYDLGVLYFDNTKDVRFSDILPALEEGKIDQSLLGSHIVYASGALLCFALDQMEIPHWQQTLMEKNKTESYTLYDLVKDQVQ